MSKDGHLPGGVTHQMIDSSLGEPEDVGVEIILDSPDDTIIEVKLDGGYLILSEMDYFGNRLTEFVFSPTLARVLARAINERVM